MVSNMAIAHPERRGTAMTTHSSSQLLAVTGTIRILPKATVAASLALLCLKALDGGFQFASIRISEQARDDFDTMFAQDRFFHGCARSSQSVDEIWNLARAVRESADNFATVVGFCAEISSQEFLFCSVVSTQGAAAVNKQALNCL